MPKAKKTKYYAVRIGHDGPNIYRNWDDCKAKVSRYPGAVHKSFLSLQEAERWLASTLNLDSTSCFNSSTRTAMSDSKPPQFNPSQTESQHDPFVQQEEFILLEPPHKPTVVLSKEQHEILKKVKDGENVFFTGSAGT
ncbi:hypothetical protein BDQ12DRAFT_685892 [Crucibulum laeve]|uniref:Ribonuclease H1 N-terminal domain-containing protein n=1 Tax=Crucibulum laeve TaxID=68775 RepID=A0A5C3LUM3_9AGAR|nr:hypothetical protein BDQ12DRAFT_685892 [Crucibulum laeve]